MKKILVITYDFPPIGLGSVQRISKLLKYLPRNGWEPIVLTSTPKIYYVRDEHLIKEIDDAGIKVYRTKGRAKNFLNNSRVIPLPAYKKYNFYRKLSRVLNIPDSKKKWNNKALKLADEIYRKEQIDLIYVSCPPFSSAIIGKQLKDKYKTKLIIDYRDSWHASPYNYYFTPYHKFKDNSYEKEILRVADKIVTINRRIKEHIISYYPKVTHNDIMILPHGYDPEDFNTSLSMLPRTTKMRFTYTGSFLKNRSWIKFLEGASLFFKRFPETRKKTELCFVGAFSKEDASIINKHGLSDVVYLVGYVNHQEYIKYLLSSNVLWLSVDEGENMDIVSTQKLFEYVGAKKPVLACVPEGIARRSLKNYDAAKICDPEDVNAIADFMKEYFDQFETNNFPLANPDITELYDYSKLIKNMVREFEFLLDIDHQLNKKDASGLHHTLRQ